MDEGAVPLERLSDSELDQLILSAEATAKAAAEAAAEAEGEEAKEATKSEKYKAAKALHTKKAEKRRRAKKKAEGTNESLMKITKSKLKQLIQEELAKVMSEEDSATPEEASLTEEDNSVFHACASHVSPKGSDAIGEVVDHTLTEDGTVEYYNVKFDSRIIEGIPAADLDIIKERHHSHKKKGKK
jgi:hypothetical protein